MFYTFSYFFIKIRLTITMLFIYIPSLKFHKPIILILNIIYLAIFIIQLLLLLRYLLSSFFSQIISPNNPSRHHNSNSNNHSHWYNPFFSFFSHYFLIVHIIKVVNLIVQLSFLTFVIKSPHIELYTVPSKKGKFIRKRLKIKHNQHDIISHKLFLS